MPTLKKLKYEDLFRIKNKPDPALFISFQLNQKRIAKSCETIPLRKFFKKIPKEHVMSDACTYFYTKLFPFNYNFRNPVYNQSEPWPLYHRNEPQYFIWNGNIKGSFCAISYCSVKNKY
jgi:hypothetical protein